MRGFLFSWKRFIEITQVEKQIARETVIPTTQKGLDRKIEVAI